MGLQDEYVTPTEDMLRAIHAVRMDVMDMRESIMQNVPAGRARSLALTKLDEMRMWSLAAITHPEAAPTP